MLECEDELKGLHVADGNCRKIEMVNDEWGTSARKEVPSGGEKKAWTCCKDG